jgi:succinate dehydrogenase / fumarate reductase flavoprotein subunit
MGRYDPERMELSTRDRVAMAVYTEIIAGRGTPNGGVYLDISHRSKEYILEKLPRMYRQFLEAQMLDISRQPMEVAPTAHYSMGGVVVDPDTTATAVEGLYAAGEVTAGLHGANRLGGNSLAETLVFGRRAGEHAARRSLSLTHTRRDPAAIHSAHAELDALIHPGAELARPLQRALRDTMWENGGVVRSEERLVHGLEAIAELKEQAKDVDVRPSSEGYKDLAVALDLRAALVVAEATLLGAQQRRESRGAHARFDYPALDPGLTGNFVIRQDGSGRLSAGFRPAAEVPEALKPYLEKRGEMALEGKLLE